MLENAVTCPVRRAMDMIGSKWKMKRIENLRDGTRRYSELKRFTDGISEKMLIQELKELVESGLVAKQQYPEVPPRVEYRLTPKGTRALPVLNSIIAFGKENL